MSLADYLAKNYLTADSDKKSKKRKRKNKDLTIADDDVLGWKKDGEEEDDDGPMIVGAPAGFAGAASKKSKKKSKSSESQLWTTVGIAARSTKEQIEADQAAADAIIASTEAARKKANEDEDEAPEVVDTEGVGAPRMENGAMAGLQSAAQVAAQMKAKEDEDRRQAAAAAKELGESAKETIYRDASGRIINVAMKRAEARKKAEDEERIKREKERAARGDVQNALAAKRKEDLADAKTMTIARYADDAELNDELKESGRWNDPAAGFLKKKKAGRSITGKPLYQGGSTPNRYGIRPGHRWDGVDRGNGFESEWFKSRNKKADREQMEYMWQQDE